VHREPAEVDVPPHDRQEEGGQDGDILIEQLARQQVGEEQRHDAGRCCHQAQRQHAVPDQLERQSEDVEEERRQLRGPPDEQRAEGGIFENAASHDPVLGLVEPDTEGLRADEVEAEGDPEADRCGQEHPPAEAGV
jgi:hypothetical protein